MLNRIVERLVPVAILAAAVATPAAAAPTFTVTLGSTFAVPGNNDFQGDLSALGLTSYTTTGSFITLSGPGRITFEYVGSESGFTDSFAAGSVTGSESDGSATFASPILLGSDIFAGGLFSALFTSNGSPIMSNPGSDSFGIFVPRGTGETYASNVIYFGFDDQINNIDDNHDDFIIRATITAVPEPATWGLMIAGFGMVGAGMRRRALQRVTA